MELTARKQKILTLITEHYIASGEPVGSKYLSAVFDTAISSATVRNEMSDLTELGFIEQTHTSSGRVPSEKGYRYYVDNLMKSYELSESEKYAIICRIDPMSGEPDRILTQAVRLLADITGCVALASTPLADNTTIARVELVLTAAKSAMIVVKTSSGVLKNSVCRCEEALSMEHVELFYNIAANVFVGKRPVDFSTAMLQTLCASLGDKALVMMPLVTTLYELVTRTSDAEVLVGGKSNLLNHREFAENAYSLSEFLNNKEPLHKLLDTGHEDFNVLIGRENLFRELENSATITAAYSIGAHKVGALGIIGPVRLDYQRYIPVLKYVSGIVSSALSESNDE